MPQVGEGSTLGDERRQGAGRVLVKGHVVGAVVAAGRTRVGVAGGSPDIAQG